MLNGQPRAATKPFTDEDPAGSDHLETERLGGPSNDLHSSRESQHKRALEERTKTNMLLMNSISSINELDTHKKSVKTSMESFEKPARLKGELVPLESIDEAMKGMPDQRNHVLHNIWQTKILSLLNAKKRSGKVLIHSIPNWVNPDDLSVN